MNREGGMVRDRPAVLLLGHLHHCWAADELFLSTTHLIESLVHEHPDDWGDASPLGKRLTAQRLGRMLATAYGINSTRMDRTGPRGYTRAALLPVWYRMGVRTDPRRLAPVRQTPPKQAGASGAAGSTGSAEPERRLEQHKQPIRDGAMPRDAHPRCVDCGEAMTLIEPGQLAHPTCEPWPPSRPAARPHALS